VVGLWCFLSTLGRVNTATLRSAASSTPYSSLVPILAKCPQSAFVDTSVCAHKGYHPRLLTLLTDGQKRTLTKELTDREKKIVDLVKQGLSHDQIAETMSEPGRNLCARMIQSFLVSAAIKLGFPNRDGLEKSLRQGVEKTKS